jgi:sporulation protein YlmC with PRC-barrel domain
VTSSSFSLRALLGRPVMLKGIRLGDPSDAVLDTESLRVVGLEVLCADGARRFLPLAAARIREDSVAVGSALVLLDDGDREFYRSRSRTFRALIGAPVEREGRSLGELVDLLVTPDGTVEAVAARVNGSSALLHESVGITISPAPEASAA